MLTAHRSTLPGLSIVNSTTIRLTRRPRLAVATTQMLLAGRVQLRHRRAATPPAVAARSSKMPKSSAPEFRIKDGSRLHSGECAQSLDVLIPARRRGTRSRTYAHRPSCRRWRLQDWHPISRDPRPALLSGQKLHGRAEDVRRQKYSPISYGITY